MNSLNFFGLKVSSFSKSELVEYIVNCFNTESSSVFYGYSLAVLSYLKKFPNYYNVTSKFDLIVTDGRLFYLIARFFKIKLKYDISIPRLTLLVLDIANTFNLNVYLLGSTSQNNCAAIKNVRNKYSKLNTVSGRDGFFTIDEEESVIKEIIETNPNVLLIGMPTPYKQELALRLKYRLKNCIIIPCGGMIDVLAGKEKLTPPFLKKIGLASFYRHVQHPQRIPELIVIGFKTVYVFTYCVIQYYLRGRRNISIPKILG